MNMPDRDETLRRVFAAAADPNPAESDSTDHPVDDDALLIEWSLGDLSAERRAEFVRHLAGCGYCRRELAAMVRAGALAPPIAEEEGEDESDEPPQSVPAPPAQRDDRSVRGTRNAIVAFVAIAASALFVLLWVQSGDMVNSTIAMSRRDLREGRPEAAFDRIGRLLSEDGDLDAETGKEARAVLEESGYRIARSHLKGSQFEEVRDIEARCRAKGGSSGRLVNLRIQARRGMAQEDVLAKRLALTDYGYENDGKRYTKNIPMIDKLSKQVDEEFAQAVAEHPDSVELRLNYGQFLMAKMNELDRAAEQFEAAARLAPDNPRPQTGLGLALFQKEKEPSIKESLKHFERAAELAPEDSAVRKNLEIVRKRVREYGVDSEP